MLWIDIKYANLLGSKLINFKIKNQHPYVANYRCPLCDDIEEKRRARGYLLEKNNKIYSYCHNCGASMLLTHFMEIIDPYLNKEYRLKILTNKWDQPKKEEIVFQKPVFHKSINLGISLLKNINNPAHNYAIKRRIPSKFYSSLYYISDINILTNQIEKYKNTKFSKESVLVIPFYNNKQEYSYINCRAISPTAPFRYYVLEVNNIYPKIWGLEFVDWNQSVFVFEGPIDAMCIPNSIAMAGVSGGFALQYLAKIKKKKEEICFVYDSDYIYNKEVKKQVIKRISEGFSVVIYDKKFLGKDVNEVICNDLMTHEEVYQYLKNRSFSGLRAQIELAHCLK